jgi:hypothetical protein
MSADTLSASLRLNVGVVLLLYQVALIESRRANTALARRGTETLR